MYLRLVYYSGERSLVENIGKDASAGIVADKTFFLDAVDNDGDALRFQHNNGSHFDVVFLENESAQQVYADILEGIREPGPCWSWTSGNGRLRPVRKAEEPVKNQLCFSFGAKVPKAFFFPMIMV